jgi:ubiquinone/menaquinone biosynthesis C-methylase UbiE
MDSKEKSQQRFGEFADGYITSQTHAKGYDLDRLIAIAQPQPDWIGLDVATGGGHTALKFAPYVKKVVATDITPRMLALAADFIISQGVTNVEFKPTDAENLPFEAEMFNLVTCRIAPHHFPDCQQFIHESWRVLKPGGILLIQDHVLPNDEAAARYVDDFERRRDPSHNRAFSLLEWTAMFAAARFTIEQTEEVIKRHQFIPWAERQGSSPEIIAELQQNLAAAPPLAATWLQAENIMGNDASFVNHHVIIRGKKA